MRGPSGIKPRPVERIGVIGLGLMGSGIAASLAAAGFTVTVVEQDAERLQIGVKRVSETIGSMARRGGLAPGEADVAVARVRTADDIEALGDADVVVEAVVEDFETKKAILRSLDKAAPGAILTSNTSYLDIDALADSTSRSGEVAGFHFFSPAHVMRAVEVVRGARTSGDAVATLVAVVRRMGKVPVVVGAGEGFVGNRILRTLRHQCDLLLEEGAYPHTVDKSLTDFGMALGPYAVADLAGLDISWAMRKRHAASRDPRARYFPAADRLCEMGRLGRKAGAGWYRYEGDRRTPLHDRSVDALIDSLSAEAGVTRRVVDPTEIVDRVMAAVVNEACLILEQGIATSAADIDLVMVHGCGFPARRGGPMFWASRRPRAEILAAIDRMIATTGFGVRRAPNVESVLEG